MLQELQNLKNQQENINKRIKILEMFLTFGTVWGHESIKYLEKDGLFKIAVEQWLPILDRLTDDEFDYAINKCNALYDEPPSYCQVLSAGLDIPSFNEVMKGRGSCLFCDMFINRVENNPFNKREEYEALRSEFLLGK